MMLRFPQDRQRRDRAVARGLLAVEAVLLVCMATAHHHVERPVITLGLFAPLMVVGFWAFGISYRQGLAKTGLAALVLQCGLVIYTFAAIYLEFGVLDTDGNRIHARADALYFSIVTWTTLGYGDLRPVEGLRLVAATEALLGYLHMGLLIPLVWWILTEARNEASDADERNAIDGAETAEMHPSRRAA